MPTRKFPDPDAARIGARLRDMRLERRISLNTVEAACGISKGHLSSIERGLAVMNVLTLVKITTALSVHVADVFREDQG
ncbi:MAG TPA: helix-turn-helix transcriptional regulator [Polyangium sp.]|nr:helix-turn-helix transcriptional regulator [Polyangium sp.]